MYMFTTLQTKNQVETIFVGRLVGRVKELECF